MNDPGKQFPFFKLDQLHAVESISNVCKDSLQFIMIELMRNDNMNERDREKLSRKICNVTVALETLRDIEELQWFYRKHIAPNNDPNAITKDM